MFFEVERSKSEFELIDTLWNVNMEVRFPNGSRIMN